MAKRKATRAAAKPAARSPSYAKRFAPERIARLRKEHPKASEAELHQYARGHKPKEHVERKAKQIERGQLTESQKASVRRLADQVASRLGEDEHEMREQMLHTFAITGPEGFEATKAKIASLKKTKRERSRGSIKRDGKVVRIEFSTAGRAAKVAEMEEFAARWGLPDWRWLFYH